MDFEARLGLVNPSQPGRQREFAQPLGQAIRVPVAALGDGRAEPPHALCELLPDIVSIVPLLALGESAATEANESADGLRIERPAVAGWVVMGSKRPQLPTI